MTSVLFNKYLWRRGGWDVFLRLTTKRGFGSVYAYWFPRFRKWIPPPKTTNCKQPKHESATICLQDAKKHLWNTVAIKIAFLWWIRMKSGAEARICQCAAQNELAGCRTTRTPDTPPLAWNVWLTVGVMR